jgi:hypothetical protein
MLITSAVITILLAVGIFFLLWKALGWSVLWSVVTGVVVGLVIGAVLYFLAFPKLGWFEAKTDSPTTEAVEAASTTTFTWNGKSYAQESILAGFVAAPFDAVECDGVSLSALAVPEEGNGYVCTSEGWKEEVLTEAPVEISQACEQSAFPTDAPPANTYWIWDQESCMWISVPFPTNNGAPTAGPTAGPETIITTTGNFGAGSCVINGQTYTLMADPSAVWMNAETLRVLAQYGGVCNVTTSKVGWYWSVGDGWITFNGESMERGNAFVADPGSWVFSYEAPDSGTTNESLGLTFRDNMPLPDDSGQYFASGSCEVNGLTYALTADSTAVWQSDELLRQLWDFGGTCSVSTTEPGWYWSTAGNITFVALNSTNSQVMANGQRLTAPIGTYTFVYGAGSETNGFTIRDNVPFGQ